MRIVIDMQGAQSTGSRNRGIGRYTMGLASAMAQQSDVVLLLNGAFADTVQPIRAAFPGTEAVVWQSGERVSYLADPDGSLRRKAEATRLEAIAALSPDAVHITSLFEGLGDDVVTSISGTDPWLTAVTLYDLIPHTNRATYLSHPPVAAWYDDKLAALGRADLLIAISAHTKQEAIGAGLGIAASRIAVALPDAERVFRCAVPGEVNEATIRSRYGLERSLVIYTGSTDYRKNLDGMIAAYAKLPRDVRQRHQLCLICALDEATQNKIASLRAAAGLSADEIVTPGFVPDDDMALLYNICAAFVFPSHSEGFGLPVLEAMRCGAAVIGSNTTSVPEVIGRDDALFDPASPDEIAAKLAVVLTNHAWRAELRDTALLRAARFAWANSAANVRAAIQNTPLGRCHRPARHV